jgi:hypothetical protein
MGWFQGPFKPEQIIHQLPGGIHAFWLQRLAKVLLFLSGLVIVIEVIGKERVEAMSAWLLWKSGALPRTELGPRLVSALSQVFHSLRSSLDLHRAKNYPAFSAVSYGRFFAIAFSIFVLLPSVIFIIAWARDCFSLFPHKWSLSGNIVFDLNRLVLNIIFAVPVTFVLGYIGLVCTVQVLEWYPRREKSFGWMLLDCLRFLLFWVLFVRVFPLWIQIIREESLWTRIWLYFLMTELAALNAVAFVIFVVGVATVAYWLLIFVLYPTLLIMARIVGTVLARKGLVWLLLVVALALLVIGFGLDLMCS